MGEVEKDNRGMGAPVNISPLCYCISVMAIYTLPSCPPSLPPSLPPFLLQDLPLGRDHVMEELKGIHLVPHGDQIC
jgi:hypothetical protein